MKKGVPGKILTTNYLNFSEPVALKKLHELKNIRLKMFDTESAGIGFHTKGYIFRKKDIYRIIIGSSNITNTALTCNREFQTNDRTAIILDETHHSTSDTYQKIMKYFKPKLWLGMTATPDKRDDHIKGRNVYEQFHYNIAAEIRLQQAMEENLLCPFHYFGITDLNIIDDENE